MIRAEVLEGEEDAMIGKTFSNRYRIDKVLGEGGMGRVYVATQLSIGREVALKTLHSAFVSEKRHLKRFYKEAQSASALTSPHVVRIHDFGLDEESGSPYISMEFLRGRTLGDCIEQEGPLGSRRCAHIMVQVLKAMMEAQQAGIVHRDLKPDNIFLVASADGDDFVKVMDFGIAKVLDSSSDSGQSLTATGTTVGTPLYMSPEQILGNQVDFRADVYSLGCILHEMITKSPPFTADERVAVMMRHMSEPAPEISNPMPCGEPLPESLRIIHQAMLAKKPDERPMTVRAMLNIFTAMDRGEPIDAAAVLASARPEVKGSDATIAGPTISTAMGTGNQTAPFASVGNSSSNINDTVAQATSQMAAARANLVGNSSAQVAVDSTVIGDSVSQEILQVASATGIETSTDLEFANQAGKKGKGGIIGAAAAVLLLLAGGGWFVMNQGNDAQTAEAQSAEEAMEQLKRADAVLAKMKKIKSDQGAGEGGEKNTADAQAAAEKVEEKKPEPDPTKAYIVVSTPKAEVFADGKKLGDTPYSHMMKKSDPPKIVELRAEGHVAKPVIIRPDGELNQIFTLEKVAPKPVAKPAPRPARKRKAASKPASKAPKKAPAKAADTVLEPW